MTGRHFNALTVNLRVDPNSADFAGYFMVKANPTASWLLLRRLPLQGASPRKGRQRVAVFFLELQVGAALSERRSEA